MSSIRLYYINKKIDEKTSDLFNVQNEYLYWKYELENNPNNREIKKKVEELKTEMIMKGVIIQNLLNKWSKLQ